jgi:5-hydroxyisourate hydrolase
MSPTRSPITTHVLDTSLGRPAAGVPARLERLLEGGASEELARGVTNDDGRIADLLPPGSLVSGTYRLRFELAPYFAADGRASFYPHVEITFDVREPSEHYHVPLLLSPFGYSTYRGS